MDFLVILQKLKKQGYVFKLVGTPRKQPCNPSNIKEKSCSHLAWKLVGTPQK